MSSDEMDRDAEYYFEGSLQSFVTPALPVVPGAPLQPRRGRPHAPGKNESPSAKDALLTLDIEVEQEADGCWIARVTTLPGLIAHGQTRQDAVEKLKALSLRLLADRSKSGEHG